MRMISVFGSNVGAAEIAHASDSIARQWMGIGPKVETFEQMFSERLRLSGLAMLDSGSNALFMAVKLLDLKPGSEVILPSFTWISCAHAIVLNGCKPVFCDVDLATHNVTGDTVGAKISPRTGAVMVVHYAGKPVRMNEVRAHGLPIIEDAAHAVDSAVAGTYCGSLGDIGIYSFDAVKNLATPEGGGLTASDPDLVAKARLLHYCGIGKSGFQASATKRRWWEYDIVDVSPKFLPNDICASIGLAQLERLDELQGRRSEIWNLYQNAFSSLSWLVRPQDAAADERHSFFTYCIRVLGGQRDDFAHYLYSKGIYTTLRYHPLHLNAIYKCSERLPISEQLNEEALSLPLHPSLSGKDIERIVTAVLDYEAT